tara:strand:- start:907 stop:1698 length:792 start_codon:yes stop_codon:yes gene_type:complete
MKTYNFCNNCGKKGHIFQNCKKPITSSGIISFSYFNNELKYLLICRKDSLGFVDFVRGKYNLNNLTHVLNLIDEMTINEKELLLTKSFDELWNYLWGNFVGNQYRGEEKISKEKFIKLKEGFSTELSLKDLLLKSKTRWVDPEWGFPKGRRNNLENDISCAIREYIEETGHQRNNFKIIENILPYEEIFTGSNFKSYKHKYYLAYIENNNINNNYYQKSEVSKIKWFTFEEMKNSIRPYSLEKLNIINKVDKTLNKFNLYNFK